MVEQHFNTFSNLRVDAKGHQTSFKSISFKSNIKLDNTCPTYYYLNMGHSRPLSKFVLTLSGSLGNNNKILQ